MSRGAEVCRLYVMVPGIRGHAHGSVITRAWTCATIAELAPFRCGLSCSTPRSRGSAARSAHRRHAHANGRDGRCACWTW
eukprot:4875734-Prymnesium_polylepis.1